VASLPSFSTNWPNDNDFVSASFREHLLPLAARATKRSALSMHHHHYICDSRPYYTRGKARARSTFEFEGGKKKRTAAPKEEI
jgi:hypothetical protein